MLKPCGGSLRSLCRAVRAPSSQRPSINTKASNRKLSAPRPKTQNEKTITLLEELFPPSGPKPKSNQKEERLVPRQGLSTLVDDGKGDNATEEAPSPKPLNLTLTLPFTNDAAILLLSRASRLLSEEDFRKVAPRGRHIEGWTHKGDVLKVIKMRDPITMVPNGSYFVIFASEESAKAYQEHVRRLHYEAGAYTRSSATDYYSPLPPPPSRPGGQGYEYISPLDAYALVPPSQTFNLGLIKRPYKPVIQHMLEAGGYPLLTKDRMSDHEVLLSADRVELTNTQVRHALGRDGVRRGSRWAIAYPGGTREIMLSMKAKSKTVTKGSIEKQQKSITPEWKEDYLKKFIISFENADEAKRFVMVWHRRDISNLVPEYTDWEIPAFVDAELIW